jgi:hypothetical protein
MKQIKCPTCGHAHPNGAGLSLCLCEDCKLVFWPYEESLLSEENQKKRKELLKAIKEAGE